VPVRDARGRRVALVGVTLELAKLAEALQAPGLPSGSSVTLVTAGNRVLARVPDFDRWVGRAAPVRAHGGADEGLEAERADLVDDGAEDLRDAGDAPAPGGDGDPPAAEHASGQVAGADGPGDLRRDVGDLGLVEVPSDAGDGG